MSDKELLELAAKAAGAIDDRETDDNSYGLHIGEVSREPYITDQNGWHEWNPLTDDGDALRLAVKLRINIYNPSDNVREPFDARTSASVYLADIDHVIYSNESGKDAAATRRAIVRAAAEIGKVSDE